MNSCEAMESTNLWAGTLTGAWSSCRTLRVTSVNMRAASSCRSPFCRWPPKAVATNDTALSTGSFATSILHSMMMTAAAAVSSVAMAREGCREEAWVWIGGEGVLAWDVNGVRPGWQGRYTALIKEGAYGLL